MSSLDKPTGVYDLYVCMYVCMYVCLSVCLYVCMYAWMHGCMDVWMYGCMDVCMYVCMYVCIWGVPKMVVPQVTMGFNTESWSNGLDDLGYPNFGKPPFFVCV